MSTAIAQRQQSDQSSAPDAGDTTRAVQKTSQADAASASTTSKPAKKAKSDQAESDAADPAAALNDAVVPTVVQPQLTNTLGFAVDPGTVQSAALQAIAALTGVQTAATAATGVASSQTTAATAATDGPTPAAATAATTAAEELAKQGVVSISGKVVGSGSVTPGTAATLAGVHTIASQTATDALAAPAQPAADVAAAQIRQISSNLPMSRMSEIRAKLQAAQIGTGKAAQIKSDATVGAAAANPDGIETAVAGVATASKGTIGQLGEKLMATAASIQTQAGTSLQGAVADTADSLVQTSTDPSALADPSLAGLGQTQTASTSVQATTAPQQAIPLSAVASTLVAHAKAGDSEFNIRLDPAGLGQIDVKMKVSSDGQVRAHLIVDQPATLDLMMRDRQQLQQSLDQAGFKTDSSSLQFSLRDQGQGQNQQQASQDQSAGNRTGSTAAVDPNVPSLEQAVYTRQSYVRADAVDLSV